MKFKLVPRILAMTVGVIITLGLSLATTFAQGTAFTYQGRLNDGASGANGNYDLRFAVYDALTLGTQQGPILTNAATVVSNGLFTVTLDFGNQFSGADRWLELGVRTTGSGAFTTLTPRQPLTPTPFAVYAANAGSATTATTAASAGSVSATNLTGVINTSQLPAGAVTVAGNIFGPHLTLASIGSGGLGGVTNLDLTKSIFGKANHLRFTDTTGIEQVWLHAVKNMDVETENDNTFWVGHDYTATVDHDFTFHVKHDEAVTVDNNLTDTIGANYSLSVGNVLTTTVGGGMSLSVANDLGITAGSFNFQANGNATTTTINNRSDTVGLNQTLSIGNSFSTSVGGSMNLSVGSSLAIITGGGVGINTASPGSAALAVNGLTTSKTARIDGNNNWNVTGSEGDFRVGNDSFRFKIGVANGGGGAGDVWMRAHGGTARVFIKTPGGTTFFSNEGETAGVSLAANGTSWAMVSDRNVKKDFAPVDQRMILEKLAAMPITQWHYKWESADVTPHIGPMAQDFKAAFYPGTDDKSITTQEADGVALAAIQGLNQKLEETRAENAELKQQLSELKQLVQTLVTKH